MTHKYIVRGEKEELSKTDIYIYKEKERERERNQQRASNYEIKKPKKTSDMMYLGWYAYLFTALRFTLSLSNAAGRSLLSWRKELLS